MQRHLLVALLVVSGGALATATSPSWSAVSGDVPSRLDALLTGLHERGLFDGALVVGNSDAIVWRKGFGYANHERAVAFRPETPADGASLAKTFTAALVLMLQQEGKLDIDGPVTRLLPDLPYADVTLRHLLSHSSGLPVPDYDVFDTLIPAGEVRTTERLIAALASARLPLAFKPGSRFEYNSFGFDLAALAAARAAGKPLSSLLGERLFKPAGMSSPFLRPGRLSDFPGVRTRGYRRVDGTVQANEVFDLEAFHDGSNIYVSAVDLHRWNVSFLAAPLLDERTLRTALQPARIGEGESGLTLGSWYRNDKGTAFWYSGHLQGFHSEVFRDLASRRSIVYVTNNTLEPWLQRGLIRAIAAVLDGREPAPQLPPPVVDVRKDDYPKLAGRWTLPNADSVAIEHVDGILSMRRRGVSYRMVQTRPAFFYVPGLDFVIGFAKAPDGGFTRMYVASNLVENWEARSLLEP